MSTETPDEMDVGNGDVGFVRILLQSVPIMFWPTKHNTHHVHPCPLCYEHFPCTESCSLWPENVGDDGVPYGSHLECEGCHPTKSPPAWAR